MRRILTAAGPWVAVLVAASCAVVLSDTDATPGEVVLGGAPDRVASSSADDWVDHADHVLVVGVERETRGRARQEDLDRGRGLIPRTVVLGVKKVLWSAPDAFSPLPDEISLPAPGWVFRDGQESVYGLENSSRLDVGHSYVKALEWIDDPNSQDPSQGHWAGLGAGDVIPFDSEVLGAGEFEGRILSQQEAESVLSRDDGRRNLRAELVGQPDSAVTDKLNATIPVLEVDDESDDCDRSGPPDLPTLLSSCSGGLRQWGLIDAWQQ